MLRQTFLLLACFLLIALSHFSESAITVKPNGDNQFSAFAVHPHIERIAAEVHPIGSAANHRVRDYIVEEFKKLGLEVKLEKGYSTRMRGETQGLMVYTENVIAVRKGTGGAKKVYVAGHYDSVFEGPGAADDAYAPASMLETARLLQEETLKNDIVFLVTDGEEGGLNGARYHQQHNTMADVGVLLNFEARGNAGPGVAFEWSDNNAWLVREMKKVAVRPIANSLSYEVYKRMWNSTDVTEFKKRGMPFINFAFIDGFSYYHNPADNPDNISKRSVQHTGENMYHLVRHFANYDFGETETGNAAYFNFFGYLVTYSASLDLFLVPLVLLFVILVVYFLVKQEEVRLGRLVLSLIAQLGIVVLTMLAVFGLSKLITAIYPEYSLFYAFQYYNYKFYFFAALGLGILVSWWLGSQLIAKVGRLTFAGGLLILLSLLLAAFHFLMPTATYVTLFPLLIFSLYVRFVEPGSQPGSWKRSVGGLLVLTVFIGIWTFVMHNLFLAFSLDLLFGPLLFGSILIMVTMTVFAKMGAKSGSVMPVFGLILFLSSLGFAHFQRTPVPEAPLPSQLFYTYDQESGKGYWATVDDHINVGHGPLLEEAIHNNLPGPLPFARWFREGNHQSTNLLPQILIDTLEGGQLVHAIKQPKRALRHLITIPEVNNLDSLVINDFTAKVFVKEQSGRFDLLLLGVGLDSMQVQLKRGNTSKPVSFRLSSRFPGLPEEIDLPYGVARRGGYTESVIGL